MTQELVLLGLLEEGPKHGYEIKRLITKIIETFTSIKTKSIYYSLRQMEKEGLVAKRVSRAGRRPEKYIYHITKKGSGKFQELLRRSFLILERPFLNIDLCLYFSPRIKPRMVLARLRTRLRGLGGVKIWLENMGKSLKEKNTPHHLQTIIQHNLELTKAEIKFTSQLIRTLTKKEALAKAE
ncbi:PadR family transcriptional regulator [bacterium]|nr:PadR family transcriptional regulator [bacterium]MBU4310507.1 PadR family transcriptional regulator [bacterium]MCG2676197.1 PadR family transcriptional regulator [bacterium]MCG2677677.1 PadR family transcriptional regulator [bacterium]